MSKTTSNLETRDFIYNALRIRLMPSQGPEVVAEAKAFLEVISQIPDEVIRDLMKDPDGRLVIYKRNNQSNDTNNGRSLTRSSKRNTKKRS
jgi:hypothetical protein